MKKRVLVIEDDADILEILEIIFQDEGFEVIPNRIGMSSSQIHSIQPDLILLDVRIAGYEKTGEDICRELKKSPATAHLPIILLSAEVGLAGLARRCGADAFISKPFEIYQLIDKVQGFMARS